MNKTIKIGIIQQQASPIAQVNQQRIAEKVLTLASHGAQLVVLEELHDSLYF